MPDRPGEPPEGPEPAEPVIRAKGPGELLALLAVRLGFHPEESLLVGCLEGPRDRLGFTLRIDLPAPRAAAAAVAGLLPVVARHGTDRVVIATVGSDGLAHAPLAELLAQALTERGVDVVEILVADPRTWWSLHCKDPACCDPAGTPYDVSCSPALAQAVLAGVPVLSSRAALAATFDPGHDTARQRVEAVVADVEAAVLRRWRRSGSPRPLHRTPSVLGHGAARVRRLLRTLDLPDDQATGELAVWVELVPVRDVAWSLMSPGTAEAHAQVWTHVARHAPDRLASAPLALAGFACWLAGDGAAAWCAVERCRALCPAYSLTELLAEALERAVPPRAWTPVPDDLLAAALDPPRALDDPAA